ncbi:MAG: hypothetical protein ACLRQF_15100 [Thomasclavelia ramosa]
MKYDYHSNIDKSSYPLDGELIKDIIKHHEGMHLILLFRMKGHYMHLKTMIIFVI